MRSALRQALRELDLYFSNPATHLRSSYNAVIDTANWQPNVTDPRCGQFDDTLLWELCRSGSIASHRAVRRRLEATPPVPRAVLYALFEELPLEVRKPWMVNLTREPDTSAQFSIAGLVPHLPQGWGRTRIKDLALELVEAALEEYLECTNKTL